MPAPARGDVLRRVGDILTRRKEEIADAMTREMGKPLTETRGDVQEGIDTAYYAASEGRRLFGHTAPSELRNKWAMSFRRPIGVAGLIAVQFSLAIRLETFPALLLVTLRVQPLKTSRTLDPLVRDCSKRDAAK